MPVPAPLDSLGRLAGRVPGYRVGRRPGSTGRHCPADRPRAEELIAVMRCCGDGVHGDRAAVERSRRAKPRRGCWTA